MLTQILAIPLAETLPTPNARKTCALAIWALQVQRLPEEVLFPAKERIASALRRGIDGELGKEGKKGSASDGLKVCTASNYVHIFIHLTCIIQAIHDLSIYQPSTFVPAFTELLPSILSNLLAPTLALRTQACHALGGFVLGVTAVRRSYLHTRISRAVSTFIMTVPPPLKRASATAPPSPIKSNDSIIVRTLRTTLQGTEPSHVAQGPVWALSVLASFVVLLSAELYANIKLARTIYGLLSIAIRHKKSSVRALACMVWRCVTWVYIQPPLPPHPDEESEVEPDEDPIMAKETAREHFWKLLKSVVDLQAGVTTIAGLLGSEDSNEDALKRSFSLLRLMMDKGGRTCHDAVETLQQMVSLEEPSGEWDSNRLLARSLFSSMPGLLSVEFTNLAQVVQPMYSDTASILDVRPLTGNEMTKDWVFDELIELWKYSIHMVEMFEEAEVPVSRVLFLVPFKSRLIPPRPRPSLFGTTCSSPMSVT